LDWHGLFTKTHQLAQSINRENRVDYLEQTKHQSGIIAGSISIGLVRVVPSPYSQSISLLNPNTLESKSFVTRSPRPLRSRLLTLTLSDRESLNGKRRSGWVFLLFLVAPHRPTVPRVSNRDMREGYEGKNFCESDLGIYIGDIRWEKVKGNGRAGRFCGFAFTLLH
jgi:hypothetical protein